MRVKMPNGVILESDNEMVNKMRLNKGGVEVKGTSGSRKGGRKTTPKEKDAGKDKDAGESQEDTDKAKE